MFLSATNEVNQDILAFALLTEHKLSSHVLILQIAPLGWNLLNNDVDSSNTASKVPLT